jgi:signal transduction histidine kinase
MEARETAVASGPLEARRLEALTAIAAAIAHSPDLDAVLSTALDATLKALDLSVGGIYLAEETGDLRATEHYRGVPPEYRKAVERFRKGEALVGRALQGPTVLVVPDISSAPEAREATRRLGLRSFAFVPLYARGRAVGLMPVGGFADRGFAAEELRLLESVGGMLGGAIENARLLEDARRHLAQVQALWETDRAIAEDRDLQEVFGTVVAQSASLGGGDAAIVLLEGEQARVAAGRGRAVQALGHPPSLAGTSVATLLRAAAPQALRIENGEPAVALLVPLRTGDGILGGLLVVKPPGEIRAGDLAVLGAFGQHVALALGRARVREMERRRAAQLALVSAAAEVAASTLDLEALLGAIARYIQRSFRYYSVAIYLTETKSRECVLAGAAGMAAVAIARGHRVRFGKGIIGWVAEHGEYVLANDVRREPRFVRAGMEATQAELSVPVRLAGEVAAVINVESDQLGAFDEGDVVAVDAIAAQVASAIRNARLFEEKVRALRNLEILQEITNALNSDLDLDALLGRIARRSVEAVRPAQMGAVLLYDGEALTVRSSFGYPTPEALSRIRVGFHEGLAGSVFVSGHGRFVRSSPEDHGAHAAAFREAAGGLDPRSALCVPISVPEEKLGVLLLENFTSPEAFDPDALLFALTLADQAAIAIRNALRLRRIVELDRHRQQYLGNVSHELRTPLTVIQGYLEALADGSAGEQAPQFLAIALDECQRLGRMIDEVLEVSRLEQGVAKKHLQWRPVALPDTLHRVLQGVRQEAMLKSLNLKERVDPDLPAVPGDERLLHLLLTNLVENAVKFTPRGGHVDVSLAREGEEVVFTVRDDGIGIPPEYHERIFEKFFMVDAGLTRSHGGAGIGLYLAREAAAIHRGTIEVDSALGQGARFTARLPLRSEE